MITGKDIFNTIIHSSRLRGQIWKTIWNEGVSHNDYQTSTSNPFRTQLFGQTVVSVIYKNFKFLATFCKISNFSPYTVDRGSYLSPTYTGQLLHRKLIWTPPVVPKTSRNAFNNQLLYLWWKTQFNQRPHPEAKPTCVFVVWGTLGTTAAAWKEAKVSVFTTTTTNTNV